MNLRTIATGAALAALIAAPAAAMDLKVSHQWPAHDDARDRAARLFFDEVRKEDDSFRFRVYPNRSLVKNPKAQIDELQKGTVEMSIYPLVYASGKIPEFAVTLMPAAVQGMEHAEALKGSRFHEILQEVAHDNGIHIVTWWWTPGAWASAAGPIAGPDSVDGLKMRGAGPYFETMLQAAGASVLSMPSSETYSAMQTGVLDAMLTSCESFQSYRIYEQSEHATVGGDRNLFVLIQPLVMAKSAWDQLTPEQKEIFERAAAKSDAFFNEQQRAACRNMEESFRENGNEVRVMTPEEFDDWAALARETAWPQFRENAERGAEILDAVTEVPTN